jgi:hypothetical protein
MRSGTQDLGISAARADALFASALQRSEEPSAAQVRQAIAAAIRAFGARGCAALVAHEYGEHPETAAQRMRWAHAVVEEAGEVGGGSGAGRPGPAPGRTTDVFRYLPRGMICELPWRSSGCAQLHSPTWLPSGSVKTANRP